MAEHAGRKPAQGTGAGWKPAPHWGSEEEEAECMESGRGATRSGLDMSRLQTPDLFL
jgi:hypothetical protein